MPQSFRRPLSWFALAALAVIVVAGSGSSGAPAGASILPPGALAPAERQRLVARRIGAILEEAHYRRATIDDKLSEQIFDRYIESLDGQRSYFLASDIAELAPFRMRFDDMIHTGDVEPAFLIFARFQQRNRERIRFALDLLKTEPDWKLSESFEFDREKAAWPASSQELDELWRKRVKSDGLSLLLTGKTWPEATEILQKRYERVLKRVDQITTEDVFENLMNAYARTFDPHSSYFSARNSEEYRIQMSLSYEGIGASLQLTDDYVTIINVIPGGPAAVAGTLNTNDRIISISQGKNGPFQEVIGWRLDDVVQLIRGKGGSLVRLQVLPAGATPGSPEKIIEFTRGKVTLENQAAKKEKRIVQRGSRQIKVGVVSVPGFYQDVQAQAQGDKDYRSTTRDTKRLLDELAKDGGVDGLVLDLRGDGGGYLPEATALTGLFIDKGPVVQLKDTTGRVEVLDDPTPGTSYDGPLIVLVDRFSASASEIFAGAIQDYRRGYIVGQRTFGKGTVQNLVPLDRWSQRPVDGQLTVTIGKFYRVTGESTQHRGVEPDITLPSPISLEDVGESALEAALPWDRIAGVPFQAIRQPATVPTVNILARDEGVRSQKDPDYKWLVADIASIDDARKQKTLSLNLEERQAERARLDRERLDRENGRRTAQGKPLLKSVEEIEADAKPDTKADAKDAEKAPDILLDQAAQIMADIVVGPTLQGTATLAKDGPPAKPETRRPN
ncbi:MAG TPA: carboxy terminal-processing peptidase [Steroidobacteraceae bacterium]|jgi:carboxyl-terminal processing protease|nr:carboxy terminal-processing peptidase [Steroidobacteraceae bacterium]